MSAENIAIVLKSEKGYNHKYNARSINHLKAMALKFALLINFGHHKCRAKRFFTNLQRDFEPSVARF